MVRYIISRVLLAVPLLVLVASLVFVLIRAIPGDPAQLLIGDYDRPEAIAEVRADLGLDRPLLVQYGLWWTNLLSGDLGRSLLTGEPVMQLMMTRFSLTAQIVLAATLIASLLALPAGLIAAWRQGTRLDAGIVTSAVLLMSVPSFWVGIVLLLVFGVKLGWAPVIGYVSVGDDLISGLMFLVLPITALVLTEMALIARVMRASTIDVLRLDYVAHARAKGLSERTVLTRHVFPNAFGPALTMIGLILGHLLGGAAIVETVFTLPGLGRLLVESIYSRDYPVVQGCLLLVAAIYVLVNLVVDVLYPIFDPRVRL
jgi:peptide/nickel transport system permease protein